jgi:hypothetical protein
MGRAAKTKQRTSQLVRSVVLLKKSTVSKVWDSARKFKKNLNKKLTNELQVREYSFTSEHEREPYTLGLVELSERVYSIRHLTQAFFTSFGRASALFSVLGSSVSQPRPHTKSHIQRNLANLD